ncbi:hypothetical protein PPL_01236 [Heterostelium album PN500]|uniref:Uncharacterized protein n=1 Tax=Heterostelium pallidum (strain ATCC 26659 / Pp 5 / PN500) TaxID=670386 RepID=D3AYH6_HETP5|nr:hypothetical protein PPL_01236 [Heterostelium album PN500]EFA86003.1 hypothetical protein PPL_01236 [Heterostelium album PN500]|eukprot:XP_020438109.1 hypothetical protein PPL_01236 [Heterostelium album PN500]
MKLANKLKFSGGSIKRVSDFDGVFDYLQLLLKHHPVTLKKRCFVSIISNTAQSEETRRQLAYLPLELKEELIHFMLEYRLFNVKIAAMTELIEVLLDPRIKSLDFSVVPSKISQLDSTKELLRAAHRIQKLDFSYCYEINDQILKLILQNCYHGAPNGIASRSSTISGPDSGSLNGSGNSLPTTSSPIGSPMITPTSTPPSTPTKNKLHRLQRLKEKILKKRKNTMDPFKLSLSDSSEADNLPPHAVVIPFDQESTSSGGNGTSSNGHSRVTGDYEESGIESLSIRHCTLFSDTILRRLLRASSSLTYLDATGTKLSGKSLQTITNHCFKLRTLSIGSLSESIVMPAITTSFCNLVNLTSLDLSYNSKIDHSVLVSILTNHHQQQQQHHNQSNHLSISTSSSSLPSPMHSPTLTPGTQPPNLLFNSAVSSSSASISSISSFGIDHSMSHQSLSSMISNGSTLSINTNRLDEANNIIVAYPSMLQCLNLAQLEIEDESLAMLPKKCPLLHTLDISYCTRICDDSLIDMTANGLITLQSLTAKVVKVSHGLVNIFKTNPLLTKLDIRFTQVKEEHLNQIPICLNNLRVIRLDGTPITDNTFRLISSSNRCLEEVGLSQCKNITFEMFNVLAENSTNFFNQSDQLSTLDVSFSPMASDDFLMVMANSNCAANLESLFVGGGFQHLEGVTVTRLVDRCPMIRIFSCLSCYKLKDSVIIDAMKRWLMLEAIELTDCTALTPNTINFLTLDTHLHYHLRFIFFGSAISEEVDEQTILNKIDGRTTVELLENNN